MPNHFFQKRCMKTTTHALQKRKRPYKWQPMMFYLALRVQAYAFPVAWKYPNMLLQSSEVPPGKTTLMHDSEKNLSNKKHACLTDIYRKIPCPCYQKNNKKTGKQLPFSPWWGDIPFFVFSPDRKLAVEVLHLPGSCFDQPEISQVPNCRGGLWDVVASTF